MPGEYAAYARALLDRKDVMLNAFDTWTLEGVKVDAFGTPDSTAATPFGSITALLPRS